MIQHHSSVIERFIADPIRESMKSKKYTVEDLKEGTPVFYRGERYYIERCPPSWDYSAHVYITDMKLRPNTPAPNDRQRFGVHPDLLDLAPVTKTPNGKHATQKSIIAKAEREARGIKDAGDIVAETLRGLDLDAAYAAAGAFLNEDEQELRDRFSHLNNGQQRMNLGNRMRNWLKKNGGQQ